MTARRTRASRRLVALLVAVALLAAACSGADSAGEESAAGSAEPSGEIVVFAASSLTEVFGRIGREFEQQHPGADVTFSFGASSTLGRQIASGAPADVYASADRRTMARVEVHDATTGIPRAFAHNRLQIAVPPDDPGNVDGIEDFARESLKLAVCAPEVPCGDAARRALAAAGVMAKPDTLEPDVKAVLTKVTLGEVDAGLVYRTDVKAAGSKVRGIDFPASRQAVNDYMISALAEAPNPEAARAFVAFVRSPQGREALADAGFELP